MLYPDSELSMVCVYISLNKEIVKGNAICFFQFLFLTANTANVNYYRSHILESESLVKLLTSSFIPYKQLPVTRSSSYLELKSTTMYL